MAPLKMASRVRAWAPWLAPLLVLAGVLVPALASASIPAQPETRVMGFDLAGVARVGLEDDLSRTSRQAYEVWYDGIASGSPVVPKSGVICGSGGPCKVYEIPAEELTAGKPYIGKTRRAIPERMADADHRLKTATGKPPQAQPLAENLTPEEAAGLEALLAQERGLGNLSNKIPPLDPSLPKNAARIEAARKLLEKARQQ